MGFYNYKLVVHRPDFEAAIAPAMVAFGHKAEDYNGEVDYDGDAWVVAEYLIESYKARAEKAESKVSSLTAEVAVLVGALRDLMRERSDDAVMFESVRRAWLNAENVLANTSEAAKAMVEVVEAAKKRKAAYEAFLSVKTHVASRQAESDFMAADNRLSDCLSALARLHAGRGA